MATINPSSLSASPVRETTDYAIELVTTRPVTGTLLETPDMPGRMFGFYDPILDAVQLYVIDKSGYRVLAI